MMCAIRQFFVLTLCIFCVCGCTPAFSGVSGTTLTRTGYPPASITAEAPFVLQGQGREWISFESSSLTHQPGGRMDYAVYAPESEGPVTRHAHALFAQPNDTTNWRFQLENAAGGPVLALNKKTVNDYPWIVQILRVQAENDWFSALWTENGREVPPLWIAKRFSTTPGDALRLVAEYREPWPACLDPEAKNLMFASRECVQGFLDRADAVFTLELRATPANLPPAARPFLQKPPFSPNMKRLAGELIEIDRMFFRR